jgi:leucyl aminopeptidase (aminopeptidase T)
MLKVGKPLRRVARKVMDNAVPIKRGEVGGKNECSIHWDSLIERPTVTADDELILKDGKFMI